MPLPLARRFGVIIISTITKITALALRCGSSVENKIQQPKISEPTPMQRMSKKPPIKVFMNGKRRLKVPFEAWSYSDAARIKDREGLI